MEDLRFFAILDDENNVINIITFPKNPNPLIKKTWAGEYIWVYDGNLWNSMNEEYSFGFYFNEEDVSYVDNILGDVQEYLNLQFPNAQINDVVINRANLPDEEIIEVLPEILLSEYPENYKIKEYSLDKSITNNPASIGYKYDLNLNAFIPPKPDPTYILDEETYEYHPDPNLEYDIHNDGQKYKWIGSGWLLVN